MRRFLYRSVVAACCSLLALAAEAALIDDMTAAREAVRTGNLKKLAEQIQKTDGSALEAYPRYWLLQAQIERLPDSEVDAFLDRYPDSFLADKLRGDAMRVAGKRADWARFENAWPKLVNWEVGSDLHCYHLQAMAQRNEVSALREARGLWFNDKGLPDACAPVFDAMFEAGVLEQSDVWTRLRLALQAGNVDLAAVLTDRLTKPDGIDGKRIREVAASPRKMLAKLNLASRGGRELALFAIDRGGRSDVQDGMNMLESLAGKLPDAERRFAMMRLAYHAARHNMPEAQAWFRQGTQSGLTAEEADWRIRAALRAGDWNALADHIDKLPVERQKEGPWRYWRARAYAEGGDVVAANRLYVDLAGQHNFYGLMAREELGSVAEASTPPYKPGAEDLQAVRQLPGVARALALQAIEWRPEGIREWNWAMRGLSDKQLIAAAEIARQANWYDRAIYSAERTREVHDFSLRYLSPYRDVTRTYAKQLGLDDAWIYGLIRQESRFITVAKSGVGASGLMQLMPATAKWVAKKIGLKFDHGEVNEIGTNVQLGTFYLKHVLDSLGNQPVLATAAYNAGPGRARAWQGNRALEGAVYAETIPFNETRDYVKKVMANAVYYSEAFGRGETSIKRRMGTIPSRSGAEIPLDDTP